MGNGCHRGDSRADFIGHARFVGLVVGVCLAVWALTGFNGVWPLWVLLFAGMKLGLHARRVFAADPPADADTDADADTAADAEDEFEIV
jgi:hypothetical protein